MTNPQREYWIVEHIWRALRALCILLATTLWLYNLSPEWVILCVYGLAAIVDQFHGKICRFIEGVLHYTYQHNDWE